VRASLLLEDGTHVVGQAHGERGERVAELVFNTAMTGYEEVLSDPSYAGQFVLFTTSHIGNTGVTGFDSESRAFCAEGFICRDFSECVDNYRAVSNLAELLKASGRFALSGVDTRYLAQRVRLAGCMKAILSTEDFDPDSLMRKLKSASDISSQDLVLKTRSFSFQNARERSAFVGGNNAQANRHGQASHRFKIVAVDCGIKRGILDSLEELGLDLHIVAPDASLEDIAAIRPDGLFISNGPGCPKQLAASTQILTIIQTFAARLPTFGICLGHQLIALAFDGDTQKLEFGHHAVNHPVVSTCELADMPAGVVMMTSQNHNYHVVEKSVREQFEITHRHMNDGTVAGLRHKRLPIFSVQFHPECTPGPHDAHALFSVFVKMLEEASNASAH